MFPNIWIWRRCELWNILSRFEISIIKWQWINTSFRGTIPTCPILTIGRLLARAYLLLDPEAVRNAIRFAIKQVGDRSSHGHGLRRRWTRLSSAVLRGAAKNRHTPFGVWRWLPRPSGLIMKWQQFALGIPLCRLRAKSTRLLLTSLAPSSLFTSSSSPSSRKNLAGMNR